jgi:AcrR family transcriptional regulator
LSAESRPSLRQQQTQLTRQLIFKALAEVVLEEGVHAFSVQRVAERAGLSHRTLYRHFPTRQALLDGLGDWAAEMYAELGLEEPASVLDLPDHARRIFENWDLHEPLVRAYVILRVTSGLEPSSRQERTRRLSALTDEWLSSLPEPERRRAALVLRTLVTTHTWHQMRADYGVSGSEAGEAVAYALQLVIDDLERRNARAGAKRRGQIEGQ